MGERASAREKGNKTKRWGTREHENERTRDCENEKTRERENERTRDRRDEGTGEQEKKRKGEQEKGRQGEDQKTRKREKWNKQTIITRTMRNDDAGSSKFATFEGTARAVETKPRQHPRVTLCPRGDRLHPAQYPRDRLAQGPCF